MSWLVSLWGREATVQLLDLMFQALDNEYFVIQGTFLYPWGHLRERERGMRKLISLSVDKFYPVKSPVWDECNLSVREKKNLPDCIREFDENQG